MPAAPAAPVAAPAAPSRVEPSKPAQSAPSAKPAPSPIPEREAGRSNFFTDEDALPPEVDAEPTKGVADKPTPDDAPLKDDDDALPDDKAPDKPADKAAPDKPAEEPPLRTNRELKKAYEANKKELRRVQAEHAAAQARLTELEGVASTAKADTGPLAEQLAAAQKKIDDYEGRLRLKAYEESDEFKTKHLVPFKRAEARAFNEVKQLEYNEGVDEGTGEARIRPATEADFIELYNLPTGKAYAFAKRVFGDSMQLAMNHYHELHRQQDDMREAISEHRANGAEQEKQTQARTAQEREAADRMWRGANEQLQAKYFKELGINTDDAEIKELLGKSYGTVDKLFGGNGSLTMAEKVGLQASVRQRAALFGVTRREVLKLRSELADANKTIEELRGSSPGKSRPKADAAPVGEYKDLADEMASYPMET